MQRITKRITKWKNVSVSEKGRRVLPVNQDTYNTLPSAGGSPLMGIRKELGRFQPKYKFNINIFMAS